MSEGAAACYGSAWGVLGSVHLQRERRPPWSQEPKFKDGVAKARTVIGPRSGTWPTRLKDVGPAELLNYPLRSRLCPFSS
jgi:hypothetical protein